jgi:aspartate/methionine/tyrosine aminotransferase
MTKFPPNDLISLLDVNLKFNLAESTPSNLVLGQIVDDTFLSELRNLELGYGTSLGYETLRQEIACRLSVSADTILTTNGASGSLFLTMFSLCNVGDEIITVSPNFPPTMVADAQLLFSKKATQLEAF